MKTLLKNRRSYKNRIGPLDQDHEHITSNGNDGEEREGGDDGEEGGGGNDGEEGEGGNDGISDWEDMYMRDDTGRANGIGIEDEDEDGGEDINGGEDGSGGEGISGEYRFGDNDEELGGNDGEGRNGEGSCSVEPAGMKRKASQDINDEPATTTRSKRKKTDGSRGDQAPFQLTKKAPSKRRNTKK